MSMMFAFDPAAYAARFAAEDYVYIPGGLTEEAYRRLSGQVDEYMVARRMPGFARGDKQQSLYDFPADNDYYQQFVRAMAALAGMEPDRLVISERHVKAYEPDAAPHPMPHKDRLATELSVGLTIRNPGRSTLVIYPDADRGVNQFQSWAELKASLPPERLPPQVLRSARRVEFVDQPGDVIAFRGNEIWHARENGADTVMLYFKINAFHSDPLGEDPRTAEFGRQTQRLAALPDDALWEQVPRLARQVDYIHRRYNCLWQEDLGVVLAGQSHFGIDEQELRLLRAMDGRYPLRALADQAGNPAERVALLGKVRRLARRGVIDLLPPVAPPVPADGSAAQWSPALVG